MTTPNPFPRHELPDQRKGQMRSFLIAEVMRDGRIDARRRPVLVAATSAAAVGTLAVGAVLVGGHLHTRAAHVSEPGGPSVPQATQSPSPSRSVTDTRPTGPHGATAACDGMVVADDAAIDDLRYLPRQVPTGYTLGESWGTVFDADCASTGSLVPVQLLTRSAAGGRPAGVVALSRKDARPGEPQPSPIDAGTTVDGITVSVAGRGHFVVNVDGWTLETAGLSATETRAMAHAAKNNGGTLPVKDPLLAGWSSVTVTGSDPALRGSHNWYVRFQSATGSDAAELNYDIHRRNGDDIVTEAFWTAAGRQTVDFFGHPALILDNGVNGVRFAWVKLTPDVILQFQVPGGTAVQTARDFLSSLEKVPASDPRIVAPNTASPSPSPTR